MGKTNQQQNSAQTFNWSSQQKPVEVVEQKDACPSDFTGWKASSDCHAYAMCNKGSLTSQWYRCSANYLFDDAASQCRPQSNVNCNENSSSAVAEEQPTQEKIQDAPIARPLRPANSGMAQDKPMKPIISSSPTPLPTKNSRTGKPTNEPVATPAAAEKPSASIWWGVSIHSKHKNKED
jgi:hypothetical protein